jgi:hypothetical protein
MYIPRERSERYNRKVDAFGFATTNFPSSTFDLLESGNCYAAGRFTGCVFHLMRALEVPLSSFADVYGVPTDKANWHNIIEAIESKLRLAGKAAKSPDEKEAHEKHCQAANGFMFFKDAWRNYTAHARGKYTEEEADAIYRNVCAFMKKLAEIGLQEEDDEKTI